MLRVIDNTIEIDGQIVGHITAPPGTLREDFIEALENGQLRREHDAELNGAYNDGYAEGLKAGEQDGYYKGYDAGRRDAERERGYA